MPCRTLQEKRDIWLFEALALFGLSTVVFVYSHTPMLLWLLGTVTFISATLTGRVDIQFYWESLRNYWSEFSDQEESIQNMYQDPTANQTPVYKNQVRPQDVFFFTPVRSIPGLSIIMLNFADFVLLDWFSDELNDCSLLETMFDKS